MILRKNLRAPAMGKQIFSTFKISQSIKLNFVFNILYMYNKKKFKKTKLFGIVHKNQNTIMSNRRNDLFVSEFFYI